MSKMLLLVETHRHEHITPDLMSLHSLHVKNCIDFEILLLTFKALDGLAPHYLSDLLTPYVPTRPLHSGDGGLTTRSIFLFKKENLKKQT